MIKWGIFVSNILMKINGYRPNWNVWNDIMIIRKLNRNEQSDVCDWTSKQIIRISKWTSQLMLFK